MTKSTEKTQQTVTKLASNKKASQTDAESKNLQKLGQEMSAPNDIKKPVNTRKS